MSSKGTDKARLMSGMRAVLGQPVGSVEDVEIAELEMIIPAEMTALLMLTNLFKAPTIREGKGPGPLPIRKTFEHRRTEALQLQDMRAALGQRVQRLRDLVDDDDAAWSARAARLHAECDQMTGRSGP